MKKQLFNALLVCLLAMPAMSIRADVIDEGQSTEGKDFWVTFMQADQNDHSDASDKAITLALTVSAKEDCKVTFTNPITGEKLDTTLTAGIQAMEEMQHVLVQTQKKLQSLAIPFIRIPLIIVPFMLNRPASSRFLQVTDVPNRSMQRTFCLLLLCWTST